MHSKNEILIFTDNQETAEHSPLKITDSAHLELVNGESFEVASCVALHEAHGVDAGYSHKAEVVKWVEGCHEYYFTPNRKVIGVGRHGI